MSEADNIIILAARFANDCHRGQKRKYNGRPYIEHPMRVAGRVSLIEGFDENYVAAAWLHDVMEDCHIQYGQLEHFFGRNVAGIVQGLTNPSKGSTLPRAERKAMDREHIRGLDVPTKAMKLLDRIDNVRELAGSDAAFSRLYASETLLLLDALSTSDRIIVTLCEELHGELCRLQA